MGGRFRAAPSLRRTSQRPPPPPPLQLALQLAVDLDDCPQAACQVGHPLQPLLCSQETKAGQKLVQPDLLEVQQL